MPQRQARSGTAPLHADDQVSARILKHFDDITAVYQVSPDELLIRMGLSPLILTDHDARLSYRTYIELLNEAAHVLGCPDIGMRLAKLQAPGTVHPASVVMHNARTLGSAFRYTAQHIYAYCPRMHFASIERPENGEWIVEFGCGSRASEDHRQGAEHAIIGAQFRAAFLSNGRAVVREIWFEHDPIAPLATYKCYARAPIRFAQAANRVIFEHSSAALPIAGRNEEVYELATRFIDMQYIKPQGSLDQQVRSVLSRISWSAEAQTSAVASRLGMHPRTFQRKLRDEGLRFDEIRDDMRRDLALHYLEHTRKPLAEIAQMLGYNEPSAFSRSCQRWFACSPGRLRQQRCATSQLEPIAPIDANPVAGVP